MKNSNFDSTTKSNYTNSSNRNRRWIIGLLIAITVGITAVSLQNILDRRAFNRGESAYKSGNCKAAIAEFDRLVNQWRLFDSDDIVARSQAKLKECQIFQTIVEQKTQGKPVVALTTAIDFLQSYPDSALVENTQQQVKALLQTKPATIAQPSVCNRLGFIEQQQLIPQRDRYLPPLLQACGQAYAKNGSYAAAIATYERFLKDYPQHSLTLTVKTALAQAIVTSVKQTGAGKIDRPPQVTQTAFGTTQVIIRNDSPDPIQIIFSGPQPRFEEIAACKDCQTYTTPPQTCPEKGIERTYTLQPGKYDIVVKSNRKGNVRPYAGTWTLENGAGYGSCFYIVRQTFPGAIPSTSIPLQ
jgi:outer membrane protein assembly factor BamD (BamD/ComL family)/rRNA maturation protein Nop10